MIPQYIQQIVVVGLLLILFILIYRETIKPAIGFLLVVVFFQFFGILTAQEILSGFSNQSIASIILLILISTGLRKNYPIEAAFDAIFKKASSYKGFMGRMMALVAVVSSFINNTPVVALMTPYVADWGIKNHISPSKLLIPLSYATILGGMITLIGTSTTLVLNGFMLDFGIGSIPATKLLIIGVVAAVFGILFMLFFGYSLLPQNKDIRQSYTENIREYIVETRIMKGSRLISKKVIDAGLRNLKGVYLVEINRNGKIISPVTPQEILQENDILFFAGNTKDIVDLIDKYQGIELPTTARYYHEDKMEVVEAVVNNFSSMIGKTVKEVQFRNRYNAAIIAIHRNGERVSGKIGDMTIEPGDLLLLFAGDDFRNRVEIFRDLFVISKLKDIHKPGKRKRNALIIVVISVLALLITGKFTLFPSLLIIVAIMAGFNLITIQDVKRELDISMIAILVFSLAIGQAIYKTETGSFLATQLINFLEPTGKVGIMIGLFLITNLLTAFVTNIGAVSIAFPLAYGISQNMQIDGMPFYLVIAYAASAAFLTPIGYQTNLIVYGPGGYNFKDFFKIGLPVNLIYGVVVILVIIALYSDVLLA